MRISFFQMISRSYGVLRVLNWNYMRVLLWAVWRETRGDIFGSTNSRSSWRVEFRALETNTCVFEFFFNEWCSRAISGNWNLMDARNRIGDRIRISIVINIVGDSWKHFMNYRFRQLCCTVVIHLLLCSAVSRWCNLFLLLAFFSVREFSSVTMFTFGIAACFIYAWDLQFSHFHSHLFSFFSRVVFISLSFVCLLQPATYIH